MWHEVPITVNGYAYPVRYTDGAHDEVFLPLLEALGRTHAAGEGRTIAFLAGAPAAGKSTFALLLERFAPEAGLKIQAVGLDGFHHYNSYLRSHEALRDGRPVSLASIKGAPESFDVGRFGGKLSELRAGGTVFWPLYDRTIHDPREDAVRIGAPIVLVEGNYLLLDEEPWAGLAQFCDYSVYLQADEEQVRERAVSRKARGGLSRAEAEAHYERSDGPNIRRVLTRSRAADFTVRLMPDGDLRRT